MCTIKDLPSLPVAGSVPVRRFSWRTGQKHRPGLEFLVSTGRHHGFESLAERDLLVALDFAATPSEVLSQPFTLRFTTAGGEVLEHIPDFLAFTPTGRWLIDVRPGHLVKDADLLRFAAASEVAFSCGWGYIVVTGWPRHVVGTLDVLSSQRRELSDAFGVQGQIYQALGSGPAGFEELAHATDLPAVARAHLLHLLWHRRVGVDLAGPFEAAMEPAIRRRRQPTMAESAVRLEVGALLVLDGVEWQVEALEAHVGRVVLARQGAEPLETSVGVLMNHPDCTVSSRSRPGVPASDRGRQPKARDDLTGWQAMVAELRLAHLLEVETGYRGGDPGRPGAGEPRPEYDPARTTLTQRRRAKAAEMKAFAQCEPELAGANGLATMSYATLVRWSRDLPELGLLACVDDRWLRPGAGHTVTEEVREALVAVHQECLQRSAVSMRSRERMIHQFIRERYGQDIAIPSYETLRKIWAEWFGAGKVKQRYVRSAATVAAVASTDHVIVRRPGQVVALDTTPVPVKLRDGVFGEPVTVYMTLALDVYSRSMVAFRLTLADTTSVDVAMLLRDVMMPLPMRPGWSAELAWPYPGIPGQVIAELAGHPVAGLPFFAPETVTTDHGGPYKSRHTTAVQRSLGVNMLPSRVLRPTDKQAVERAFDSAKTMLFQLLPGYTGSDVSERGADPEGDC
ncbi:MAG TPA: TnsA-like heteromeric transposase endonuclease subunit, partial [Pseudonocardiaceae bacterium]|nr:TnsA-like heteromeric transposase endonuclease subunit [Pseudonocardiaceae bacterium]